MNEYHDLRGIDPETYACEIHPSLERYSEREQISFAHSCASRVVDLYRVFDPTECTIELAAHSVELWMEGKCGVDEIKRLESKVESAFNRAMDSYNSTDLNNNTFRASPAGVKAYQASEAARSVHELLLAVIYSAATNRDDYMNPTDYCAASAASALSAAIDDEQELAIQRRFLDANSEDGSS